MPRRLLIISACVLTFSTSTIAQQKAEFELDTSAVEIQTLAKAVEGINPKRRPSDNLTNVPARYFIWYDDTGWHVRSAAKKGTSTRFRGRVTIHNAKVRTLRPVGLDKKGSLADRWAVNPDKSHVEFDIKTSGSFDGFDFTVDGDTGAYVEFQTWIGLRKYVKRVFIGGKGEHPKENRFAFPARPKL